MSKKKHLDFRLEGKSKNSNRTALLFVFAAIINLASICLIYPISNAVGGKNYQTTHIQVSVVDASDKAPLLGAVVCIAETRQYYTTNKSGKTENIEIPYIVNSIGGLDDSFGSITIFIFKEGYVDFMLFYALTYKNSTRFGPQIPLYRDDGSLSLHTLVEAPPDSFTYSLARELKEGFKKG